MSLGLDDFFGGQPNEIASPIPPRIRRAMHSIALKQFGGLCLLVGGSTEKQPLDGWCIDVLISHHSCLAVSMEASSRAKHASSTRLN